MLVMGYKLIWRLILGSKLARRNEIHCTLARKYVASYYRSQANRYDLNSALFSWYL